MKNLKDIIREHPFFNGLSPDEIDFISGCAKHKTFKQNEIIANENDPADEFYLIRQGKVAICATMPNRENKIIQTFNEGDIFDWAWLFPPYRWMFEAIALEPTVTFALNGQCLRKKCDESPSMGYIFVKRVSQLIVARLNATRLQLLDVYGKHHE